MSYLVYLTLLPPLLIGMLLAACVLLPTRKANALLLLSLGIPLGFGISACLFFLWSLVFNPSFPGFLFVELALIGVLSIILWKQRQHFQSIRPEFLKWNRFDWLGVAVLLIVMILGLATFAAYTQTDPHGRYDSWAIWTVRARMLTRGGINWKSVFVPQIFHADYPLLVPLTIAHSWIIAGTESQRIPPAVAGLFTFAPAGILIGTLISLQKRIHGWLAGILLLSTPWVIYFGSLQFADLPLAACMLAASSCLCLSLYDREHAARWLCLAGLSAGLAAWTKNEGQLFLAVFIAVSVFSIWLTFRRAHPARLIGMMLVGIALPLFVLLIFKFTLAPANDVVDTGNLSVVVTRLLSPTRYGEVIAALQIYHKGFGGWLAPIPLLFVFVWLLFKPYPDEHNRAAILPLAALLGFQWIGYFLIYVITPHQLQIHVNQSYDRLLMHLYPSFLLFLFLFLSPWEKVFKNDQ